MVRRSVGLRLLCVGALLALSVSMAQADTGNIVEPQKNPTVNLPATHGNGFQASTCLTDEPAGASPFYRCSAETGAALYTVAGGHPPIGFTQYIIRHGALGEAALENAGGPIAACPNAELCTPTTPNE